MGGTWVTGGFVTLDTLGNVASVSSLERLLFTPIAPLLTASSLEVALSKKPAEAA